MISGSGNYRHRHARGHGGQGGEAGREPNTWTGDEPNTWTGNEPNTWTGDDGWREPDTWTERQPRKRPLKARVIVPMAIPMALALALGMVLALSGKAPSTRLNESALGVKAGQNTSQAGQNTSQAGQNTSQAGQAGQRTTTGLVMTNRAMSCDLVVPRGALSARGLATSYQLTGPDGESPASSGCEQSNPGLRAFVQATILDPATGALYVYEPLVVTLGSNPAAAPVVPSLPRDAVVDIMIGFNGNSLRLVGAGPDTLADEKCVNGVDGSLFGKAAFCNGAAFFEAASQAMTDGRLKVPASGDSPVTKLPCPTVRSFTLAGQDLGDGVTTDYLLTANGATAQDNAANRAALAGTATIGNASDSRLLDDAVLPALGCVPFTVPNLSAGGAPGTSQALEELSAAQNQGAPIALVPENDPMTMINGAFSFVKTTLYRQGTGQPFSAQQADTPGNFCANMLNFQTQFLAANATRLFATPSPVPAVGDNLLTYLASRLSASYTGLRCANYGLKNTVRLFKNSRGVATGVTLTVTGQEPRGGGGSSPQPIPLPTASPQTNL
jgi:hypothetical protein